jgi:hypothetical protein
VEAILRSCGVRRCLCGAVVGVAILLIGAGSAYASPPSNDAFANAQVIPSIPQTVNGTNVEATDEPGEPLHENDSSPGPTQSVWYRWTPSVDTALVVDTCATVSGGGSLDDSAIAIYTGGAVNALTRVGKNDDSCGFLSGIKFNAQGGTTYSIAVDGFAAATGTFTLRFRPPSLANDNFANPVVLSGLTPTASGSNLGATAEASEPNHAGQAASASLWYRWQAPASGEFLIAVCGNFVSRLAVYTGSSLGGLAAVDAVTGSTTPEASGCYESAIELAATSGVTYRIVVDGLTFDAENKQAGDFDLAIGGAPSPPANDDLANATALTTGVPLTGTNVGATKQAGEPNHASNGAGHSVWYRWVANEQRVEVDSCGSAISTVVGVYTGAAVNALTRISDGTGCAGGNGFTFDPVSGTTYWIAVDGKADDLMGDTGVLSIRLTPRAVPLPPSGGGGGTTPDTTPPVVKIDSGPKKKTAKASATLAFSANEPAAFKCTLTGKKASPALAQPAACTSPALYKKLKPGKYTFTVRAYDAALNASLPAAWSWKVVKKK